MSPKFLILTTVLLAGCGAKHEATKAADARPVAATVARVEEQNVPEMYEATGTVKARSTTVLSARLMGAIRELRPQPGETVRAGQLVAVIDAREIEAALRQARAGRDEAQNGMPEVVSAIAAAQAQLDLANSTFARMKSLADQKSITAQELDEVSARRRMAEAQLEMARAKRLQLQQKIQQASEAVAQAEAQKSYLEVRAPFAGLVVERKAEPGMLASPGMPLLVLEQAGGYRLEAAVEESRLAKIRPGMNVQVKLEGAEERAGRVEEVVPALDAGSRTFTVKIGLSGGLLRSGMFGRAGFPMGERKALTVPASSVRKQGQVEQVMVVTGGVGRIRMVTTGARSGARLEILSGLSAGDTVVSSLSPEMEDGTKIEVRQ
jgi:multidrug efflux pump subunit AcrA (membrane-fusion protein)